MIFNFSHIRTRTKILFALGNCFQFYLMFALIVGFLCTARVSWPAVIDESKATDLGFVVYLHAQMLKFFIPTLFLLLAEYLIFFALIRRRSLCAAIRVLLIVNLIHALPWLLISLCFLWPMPTLIRLALSSACYGAILCGDRETTWRPRSLFAHLANALTSVAWLKTLFVGALQIPERMILTTKAFFLAISGRWITASDIQGDYDALAADYDANWLARLEPTTREFLDLALAKTLPDGPILDLGCGTGATTARLAARFPEREIVGVDLSPQMLRRAEERCGAFPNVRFECGDLLSFVKNRPDHLAAMLLSCWSVGYSDPEAFLRRVSRVLAPDGVGAILVNTRDTLPAVFRAYVQTMRRFPLRLRRAIRPRFPRSFSALWRMTPDSLSLVAGGDGRFELDVPPPMNGSTGCAKREFSQDSHRRCRSKPIRPFGAILPNESSAPSPAGSIATPG